MTRRTKQFFDGFALQKLTVTIKQHPQTEFLLNVRAPPRIIFRRKTIAVDEKVEMNQIVDVVEPVVPIRAARIINRRNTTAVNRVEPVPIFDEMLSDKTTAVSTSHPRTQVVDTSENPLDLTMKTVIASIQSAQSTIDNQLLLLQTPINTSSQRSVPRNLFRGQSSTRTSASQSLQEAIEQRSDQRILQSYLMPNKKIPELLPIDLTRNSENVNTPNLAMEPLQYVEYWKKRIGSNGPFSDSTNLQKK